MCSRHLPTMVVVLLVLMTEAAAPPSVSAQRIEADLGGGYVFGGGAEDPGPSLPTLDAGVVAWPLDRWGVAVRWVNGPGEDLYARPVPGGDRTFLGSGHLSYWTVTARHRRTMSRHLGLELGLGLMKSGRFSTIQVLRDPPLRLDGPSTFFGGLSMEVLVSRRLSRYLAVKGGVTFDANVETANLQPVLLVSLRY